MLKRSVVSLVALFISPLHQSAVLLGHRTFVMTVSGDTVLRSFSWFDLH